MKTVTLTRRQEGYTILELLAALAILGLIISAIYSFYLAGLKSWHRGIEQMDSQQSARIAMDKMIRELRYASAVEVRSDEEICFYLAGDTKTYLFRKAGQELVFESKLNNTTKSHTKIALGITALKFSIDQTNTVHITISTGNEAQPVTLRGSVRPRNLP